MALSANSVISSEAGERRFLGWLQLGCAVCLGAAGGLGEFWIAAGVYPALDAGPE
jgi:hypothetical protein